MLERNEIILNRYRKCHELREKGINPFPYRYNATHKSSEVLSKVDELIHSKDKVKVAGRVLTIRSFGKTSFFHLQDDKGKIQIYIKEDIVGSEKFEFFTKYLETGDIMGVEGEVFHTKTGEVTVAAKDLVLLAKSMRPLPEKWHGLKDVELRYRQRYLDLIVNQEVKEKFLFRTKIIKVMRQCLDEQGYVEVETPMMQPVYGGARARPFTTYHNVLALNLYLRIAPELYLKRLVVGGLEKVYEINRSFRNEGISTQHNPEFTMLELYTAYWNYQDMMNFLEELIKEVCRQISGELKINYQGNQIDLKGEWPRMTVLEAIGKETGLKLDWRESKDKVLKEIAGVVEISEEIEKLSVAELIMHVFDSQVEDKLIKPIFITEFPKALSPLAKAKEGNPAVAERFELFIGGLEVANAYSELNDPEEQYEAFKEQMERRQKGDLEAFMMDEDYIRALEYGMPPTSGLGVGIDRLVMLFTDSPSIRDVILFPQLRPESGESATTKKLLSTEESQETK